MQGLTICFKNILLNFLTVWDLIIKVMEEPHKESLELNDIPTLKEINFQHHL